MSQFVPGPPPGSGHAGIGNHLLRTLPADVLALLRPRLERVALPLGVLLLASEGPIHHVHFPESGVVSMITAFEEGVQVEVGLVGCEGMVGLPALLGVGTSSLEALVQVEGVALRMGAPAFRAALAEAPALAAHLLRYVDAFQAQVAQSAACNARHRVEQRLARWLLMTHDRTGGDAFPMTQAFLATMLAVRRPGVTLAMGALRRAGLVAHGRGAVRVLDRAGLEAVACECYGAVRRRFVALGTGYGRRDGG